MVKPVVDHKRHAVCIKFEKPNLKEGFHRFAALAPPTHYPLDRSCVQTA